MLLFSSPLLFSGLRCRHTMKPVQDEGGGLTVLSSGLHVPHPTMGRGEGEYRGVSPNWRRIGCTPPVSARYDGLAICA